MLENIPNRPDAFSAFVVLFRYAENQAKKNSAGTAVAYNPDAMICALQKLYNTNPDRQAQYFNAPQMLAGLEQILAQTGQEDLLGNLEAKENIQIVGLLLDAILADSAIPSGVMPYFQKLQFPLLIAAFADPGLLHGTTHPARDLLNQLAYFALSTNPQGEIDNPELLQSLEQVMAIVSNDAANSPGCFIEALDAMSTLTAHLRKSFAMRLDRVIDTCQGGHRLDQARLLVRKEIDARIGGKRIPKFISDLLAAGWQQLLVLTCLRQGTDAEAWRQELSVIDQLWDSIDNKTSSGRTQTQELIKFMLERLYSVGTEPALASRLTETIQHYLIAGNGDPALEWIDFPAEDIEREEKLALLNARLQSFNVGDWIRLANSRNTWTPLRLTWIGQNPGRYVWVNQKGVKALELNPEQFVRLLDEKRAGRIESLEELHVVERAAKSLLYTLRERMR